MDQQELNEEAAILDKACRRCGGELEQIGGNHLRAPAAAIGALVRKLDRLEAAAKSLIVPLDAQPSEPIEKSDASQAGHLSSRQQPAPTFTPFLTPHDLKAVRHQHKPCKP